MVDDGRTSGRGNTTRKRGKWKKRKGRKKERKNLSLYLSLVKRGPRWNDVTRRYKVYKILHYHANTPLSDVCNRTPARRANEFLRGETKYFQPIEQIRSSFPIARGIIWKLPLLWPRLDRSSTIEQWTSFMARGSVLWNAKIILLISAQ